MGIVRKRIANLADMLTGENLSQEQVENDFINVLIPRIKAGAAIPIISSSLYFENIFCEKSAPDSAALETQSEPDTPVETGSEPVMHPEGNTVEGQLSATWAKLIGYPLHDSYNLARVAQYHRTNAVDSEEAKRDYLRFIKSALLAFARNNGKNPKLVNELTTQFDECTFSEIAHQLDCLELIAGNDNSLRILARLPFSVYLTTSPFDFLQRALKLENKTPHTQVCVWRSDAFKVKAEHLPNPNYTPTAGEPLVYHLLGLESYHNSIAISEDDYLDFLTAVLQDTNALAPVIPLYLRDILSSSSLILLGYRLEDWDFRALFRGVILPREPANLRMSLIFQLTPDKQYLIQDEKEEKARKYLERYFTPKSFRVEWSETEIYLKRLWTEWKKRSE